MLRDRYDPVDLFALVPQLGLQFEPQLAQLDRLLDDDAIFRRIRTELARRYPLTPVHGRPSTPVEVVLRLLVVMRLYSWSYAQTEYFVHDTLISWIKRIVNEQLCPNPNCLYFPCSHLFAWIFPPAGPPRYNEG